MNSLIKLFTAGLVVSFQLISAQSIDRCAHCKMQIGDPLHKATASLKGETLSFDAVECLVNYIKSPANIELSALLVADYTTGELIPAESAYYLKSKSLPSPMGAFLTAFSSESAAEKMKIKKGGNIYSWAQIKEQFKNSDFGSFDHEHHHHNRPDAHGPIGVMGDHLHHKGGLMISLRYMNMAMAGNIKGSAPINDNIIFEDYMTAPQQMNMQMYMLGAMYAPSNSITLMIMQNYSVNNMELTSRMMMDGMEMKRDFSTASSGLGDTKIGGLFGVFSNESNSLHINTQINIPTGSIQERDNTPMMDDAKLPYRMQLGSGTFDYTLGGTYKGSTNRGSFGVQVLGTLRTGENSEGYRLGNLLQLHAWGAYLLNSNISLSGRLQGSYEGSLVGQDDQLNPRMVTAADSKNYGGEIVRAFIGINIAFAEGSTLRKLRIGAETGMPVYENYNGIQMNEGLILNFGAKYSIL